MDENGNLFTQKRKWDIQPSIMARNTFNPIRAIVDGMKIEPNPEKEMIALSLGDPTVFGNLPPPQEAITAVQEAAAAEKFNGYAPSSGFLDARQAVARYMSTDTETLGPDDIFLTSGCSHALELAISVLVNPGENILIPRPGFSLYQTLALSQGIEIQSYDCQPDNNWRVDLDHLQSLINDKTRGIVIVNPSNPCGSNFNKSHVQDIIGVAEKYRLPIIADEIYAHIVFPGKEFISCASQSTNVPILTCSGIGKRFLVPGWRLGWVAINDRNGIFGDTIRRGLMSLSQRILGPCTIIQAAVKDILEKVPDSFHRQTTEMLENCAKHCCKHLDRVNGLKPVAPEAAFYIMVGIELEHFPEFNNDVEFTSALISEQSVFCLPAKCFNYPNYFRIVITMPHKQMHEALNRLEEFCSKHYVEAEQ